MIKGYALDGTYPKISFLSSDQDALAFHLAALWSIDTQGYPRARSKQAPQQVVHAHTTYSTRCYEVHTPLVDFKEVFFKPYRIIYEIRGKTVFIHAVLDGRRNCEDLLQQRLLGTQ